MKAWQRAMLLLTAASCILLYPACQSNKEPKPEDSNTDSDFQLDRSALASNPSQTGSGLPDKNPSETIANRIDPSSSYANHPDASLPDTVNSNVPTKINHTNLRLHGAVGDGITDDAAALQAALQAVGNDGCITIPQGTYAIGTSLTIPLNVVLKVENGGKLVVKEGTLLTINGWVEAGYYSIFGGSGSLAGVIKGAGCPQWFGAAGDSITDDTAAFQQAVDHLDHVMVPYKAAKYKLSTVTLSKKVILEGVGSDRIDILSARCSAKNGKLFIINSSNVAIRNFTFTVSGTADATSALLYFDNSTKAMSDIEIENIYSSYAGYTIKDAADTAHPIRNVSLRRITASFGSNTGLYLSGFEKGIVMEEVLVNEVGMPASSISFPLMVIKNCKGLKIRDLDVAGGFSFDPSNPGRGGDGLVMENCQNVTAQRFMADYINGYCLRLHNCANLQLDSWVMSLYEDGAVYMEGIRNSSFRLLKLNGIWGSAASTHPGTAFMMKNCWDNTFDNTIVQQNLSEAMRIENSSRNVFNSLIVLSNNGDGYVETGSCSSNQLRGAVFSDNKGKDIQKADATDMLFGSVIDGQYKQKGL